MKGREFIEQLNNSQLSKEDYTTDLVKLVKSLSQDLTNPSLWHRNSLYLDVSSNNKSLFTSIKSKASCPSQRSPQDGDNALHIFVFIRK